MPDITTEIVDDSDCVGDGKYHTEDHIKHFGYCLSCWAAHACECSRDGEPTHL